MKRDMLFRKTKINCAGSYPRCFDSQEQYSAWRAASVISKSRPIALFCSDCTPQYQHEMMGEHRCENSHVMFRMFGKGPDRGIEGYLENKK